ncbi:hypothetical protein KAT24_02485 [Candidatus Pacearchaeota archaeon]|nr:hypothetical protein [Candidatus Pacearchaeota archaeon]
MIERGFLTNVTREYLENQNFLMAMIKCATDLEQLLFEKLFFERKIKQKLMSGWTLRKYIDWTIGLELVDKKYESLLREFNWIRNKIIHNRMFIDTIIKDRRSKELIRDIILSVCKFLDNMRVIHDYSQELENNYSIFLESLRGEYDLFLSKDYNFYMEEEENE